MRSITNVDPIERKGKTLHLLKQGTKPVPGNRKRKRHEVFDPAEPLVDWNMEEAKAADKEELKQDGFADVTGKLKSKGRQKKYEANEN